LETLRVWGRQGFGGGEDLVAAKICRRRGFVSGEGLGGGENLKGIGSSQDLTAHRICSQQHLTRNRIWLTAGFGHDHDGSVN